MCGCRSDADWSRDIWLAGDRVSLDSAQKIKNKKQKNLSNQWQSGLCDGGILDQQSKWVQRVIDWVINQSHPPTRPDSEPLVADAKTWLAMEIKGWPPIAVVFLPPPPGPSLPWTANRPARWVRLYKGPTSHFRVALEFWPWSWHRRNAVFLPSQSIHTPLSLYATPPLFSFFLFLN